MRFIYVFIIFISTAAFSQNTNTLTGCVLESGSDEPVFNAYIKIRNLKTAASTSKNGKFTLNVLKFPVDIIITHVSYESQYLTLHNSDLKNLNIYLVKVNHNIPEIVITANKVNNLVEKKLFAVSDYEFMGNNILTLLFNYLCPKHCNPWLVLMNTNGDTLCCTPAGKDGTFYKDCTGTINLVDEKNTHQVYYDSARFYLLYPAKTKDFFEIMQPCVSCNGYYYYLNRFTDNSQILSYNVANNKDTTYKRFRVITDKAGLKILYSRSRFYAMSTSPVTEADLRFEKMCFFNPVYAPLFKIKNKIVIFNFTNSEIEFYNETGQLEKEIQIDFHKQPFWKEEIIIDEACSKAYSHFLKNGISELKEIDLQTGKFVRNIKIPKFKFISKIKINNNRLYFLYRKSNSDDLTGLYMMEL